MEFITKSLKALNQKANLPTLYRLQGYCKAKGYHFYMYNCCTNNDYKISRIKINDKKDNFLATANVDIPMWYKIETEVQYC